MVTVLVFEEFAVPEENNGHSECHGYDDCSA